MITTRNSWIPILPIIRISHEYKQHVISFISVFHDLIDSGAVDAESFHRQMCYHDDQHMRHWLIRVSFFLSEEILKKACASFSTGDVSWITLMFLVQCAASFSSCRIRKLAISIGSSLQWNRISLCTFAVLLSNRQRTASSFAILKKISFIGSCLLWIRHSQLYTKFTYNLCWNALMTSCMRKV